MRRITLYTGGGISLSPVYTEGRRASAFVRLIADDGKGITNGTIITTGIDTRTPEAWTDCDAPAAPEEEISDEEALEIITGGAVNETL